MRTIRLNPTLVFGAFAATFAVAGFLAGCGDSSPKSTAIPQTLSVNPGNFVPGTGPFPVFGTSNCFQGLAACTNAAQFEGTCRYVGGYITNRFGPSVCVLTHRYDYQTHLELTFYSPNVLPIITPSIPTGGLSTGIRVRKGAKLSYFTLRHGKWGYFRQSSSSAWGGRISWTTFGTNCNSVDWDGYGRNGQITNESQPAGLFGSDGTESFYLGGGSARRVITIHNDGVLRLGINADPSTPFGCTSPGYAIFDLTTCEDASGNTYACVSG